MKIITSAGYYRTGSSAVTDFFTEFDNCESLGDYEFRFLQDPDGVKDLEYHIVDSNHRHNTSHAIKRFRKYSKFENGHFWDKRYQKFFGKYYWKETLRYIEDITKLVAKTKWRNDIFDHGEIFYQLDRVFSKLYSLIYKDRRMSMLTLKGEKGFYTDINREEFYEKTRKYTRNLLNYVNKNNAEYMMVDQLAAPYNANCYLNYVDDMYIIIVERDPRDLFLLEHLRYRWGTIPQDDVKEFCEWYKITRSHRKHESYSDRVLVIYLEDLIYKYDLTSKKLMNLVGLTLEEHTKAKTKFIPERSVEGTKLWVKHPEMAQEIAYIERELSDYLYDYGN